LKQQFSKSHENEKGYFSCEEFRNVIKQGVDLKGNVGNFIFPQGYILDRAFLYALTCHKNTIEIN
jgi:hypothetical protein